MKPHAVSEGHCFSLHITWWIQAKLHVEVLTDENIKYCHFIALYEEQANERIKVPGSALSQMGWLIFDRENSYYLLHAYKTLNPCKWRNHHVILHYISAILLTV